jgi:hypothetical protein
MTAARPGEGIDWKVGTKVLVVNHRWSQRGQPERRQWGTVTKVGRKWATVRYDGWSSSDQFEMATGMMRLDFRGISSASVWASEALRDADLEYRRKLREAKAGVAALRDAPADLVNRLHGLLDEFGLIAKDVLA